MWPGIINEARAVLLVGECNFSFSVSLLEITDRPSIITSTCFETDPEEQPRKANITLLRGKGVRILLGVDATKLAENECLYDKFDCIIFNFPHIGGKSRIHLNRELLRSFFSSAASCLGEGEKSCIIVTLCQGQGGVPCDQPRRHRAYGDTWKVVEMAAYGGLILKRIEHFPAKLFQSYIPSGYGKHGEKGFHVDDSLTYVFCKSRPHRIGLPMGSEPFVPESLHELLNPESFDTHFGSITCSRVHSSLYHRKPIESPPISCVVQYLIEQVNVQKVINADEEVPLHLFRGKMAKTYVCRKCGVFSPKLKKDAQLATCTVDGSPAYLRDSLVHALQYLSLPNSAVLVKGSVFRDLGETLSVPPVGAEAMFSGNGSIAAILSVLTKLSGGPGHCVLKMLNANSEPHSKCISSSPTFEVISVDKMLVLGHLFVGLDACTVDLDNVALMIFNASDWREVRSKCCKVLPYDEDSSFRPFQGKIQPKVSIQSVHRDFPIFKNGVQFVPESLFPPTFTFDVCFSENGIYSEKEFWYIIWHLVGDVAISVELIDCYHPSPERMAQGHRTSWCFRLKYRSYEWPLHRKLAVRIQNEVLHWGLVNVLGVSVK